jgi:peptidoglycan/LPS O-acetylase OafA/YrhL/GT2 family glycosyltransferase
MTGQTSPSRRLTELDSLRGLAALTVVFAHYLHLFPAGPGPYQPVGDVVAVVSATPLYIIFAGREAVILFFLLSGFVLSLPWLEGRAMDYSAFVIRRGFRIWVPYVVAVFGAVALNALCYRGPIEGVTEWFNRSWSDPLTVRSVADHLLLVGTFDFNQFNPAFWSLVHEMRVSLVFPFVMALCVRKKWLHVTLAAGILSLLGVLASKQWGGGTDFFYSIHYLAFFMVGMLLARHRTELSGWFAGLPLASKAAMVAFALATYAYGRWAKYVFLQDWVIAVGASLGIVASLSGGGFARFLNRRPVRFLGEVSYSLYLTHAALMLCAVHLLHDVLPMGAILALAFAATLVLTAASYRWVELPAIAAGRFLCRWREARRIKAPALTPGRATPAYSIPVPALSLLPPVEPPLVSILIVTWNRRNELVRCLESAQAQSWPRKEIVVVDNASTDGTAEMVAHRFPNVRVVRAGQNLGCPSGRNLGFRHCHGSYIYMLDDDGWLHEDAVEVSVRRAESDPAIGVVMSLIHEIEGGHLVRQRPAAPARPAFQAGFSGGCSLVRRAALDRAGFFPEDFFRQAEETDLALRLLQTGYFCFLEPASVMFHAPSAIGRDDRAFMFYSLRNTNRIGLRLWPFPWCVLRPFVNFVHAVRYMVRLRDPWLPVRVVAAFMHDLRTMPSGRRPVSVSTYRLFRRLQARPSAIRPV